jgi:hypothetical protein
MVYGAAETFPPYVQRHGEGLARLSGKVLPDVGQTPRDMVAASRWALVDPTSATSIGVCMHPPAGQ